MKITDEFLKELETKFREEGPLYFKEENKPGVPLDFKYIRDITKYLRTSGLNTTYDSTEGPCYYRSLGDIYRIVNYYFPKKSLKVVFLVILREVFSGFNTEEGIKYWRSQICGTIGKRVYTSRRDFADFASSFKDELGLTREDYMEFYEKYRREPI